MHREIPTLILKSKMLVHTYNVFNSSSAGIISGCARAVIEAKPFPIPVWNQASSATLPLLLTRLDKIELDGAPELRGVPTGLIRGRVREGVPPPLCAGRCGAPPAGPVCAFDAAGTARTFATLCELEAVSCRESTCKF